MDSLRSGLLFDGIDKQFGVTYALRDVSRPVGRSEIVALPGENGARSIQGGTCAIGQTRAVQAEGREKLGNSDAFDSNIPYREACAQIWGT